MGCSNSKSVETVETQEENKVIEPTPLDPVESIFIQLQSNDTMKLLEACTTIKRDLDARSSTGLQLSHSEKVISQLFRLLNSEKDDICIRICDILLIESRISFDSVKTAYDNCHPIETLYKCINSSNTEVREKAQDLKSRLDPTSVSPTPSETPSSTLTPTIRDAPTTVEDVKITLTEGEKEKNEVNSPSAPIGDLIKRLKPRNQTEVERNSIITDISINIKSDKTQMKLLQNKSMIETLLDCIVSTSVKYNDILIIICNLIYQIIEESDDLQNYFITHNGFKILLPLLNIGNNSIKVQLTINICNIINILCENKDDNFIDFSQNKGIILLCQSLTDNNNNNNDQENNINEMKKAIIYTLSVLPFNEDNEGDILKTKCIEVLIEYLSLENIDLTLLSLNALYTLSITEEIREYMANKYSLVETLINLLLVKLKHFDLQTAGVKLLIDIVGNGESCEKLDEESVMKIINNGLSYIENKVLVCYSLELLLSLLDNEFNFPSNSPIYSQLLKLLKLSDERNNTSENSNNNDDNSNSNDISYIISLSCQALCFIFESVEGLEVPAVEYNKYIKECIDNSKCYNLNVEQIAKLRYILSLINLSESERKKIDKIIDNLDNNKDIEISLKSYQEMISEDKPNKTEVIDYSSERIVFPIVQILPNHKNSVKMANLVCKILTVLCKNSICFVNSLSNTHIISDLLPFLQLEISKIHSILRLLLVMDVTKHLITNGIDSEEVLKPLLKCFESTEEDMIIIACKTISLLCDNSNENQYCFRNIGGVDIVIKLLKKMKTEKVKIELYKLLEVIVNYSENEVYIGTKGVIEILLKDMKQKEVPITYMLVLVNALSLFCDCPENRDILRNKKGLDIVNNLHSLNNQDINLIVDEINRRMATDDKEELGRDYELSDLEDNDDYSDDEFNLKEDKFEKKVNEMNRVKVPQEKVNILNELTKMINKNDANREIIQSSYFSSITKYLDSKSNDVQFAALKLTNELLNYSTEKSIVFDKRALSRLITLLNSKRIEVITLVLHILVITTKHNYRSLMKLYEGNGYDILYKLLLTDKISIDNVSNIFILLIRLYNHNHCIYKSDLSIEIFTKLIEYSKCPNPLAQVYACYIIANICRDETNKNLVSVFIKERIIDIYISLLEIQSNYIQSLIYQSIILILSNQSITKQLLTTNIIKIIIKQYKSENDPKDIEYMVCYILHVLSKNNKEIENIILDQINVKSLSKLLVMNKSIYIGSICSLLLFHYNSNNNSKSYLENNEEVMKTLINILMSSKYEEIIKSTSQLMNILSLKFLPELKKNKSLIDRIKHLENNVSTQTKMTLKDLINRIIL